MFSSNCCFLTCIQVSEEAGQVVWYSHLLQNFPQFIVIHTVEGFGVVNKAEIDGFLELSCFFDDPEDIGNLISSSSAFSKTSLNIWKFLVHVLLKPGLENFEHYFPSLWDECNCVVVWAFFGIAFIRDWIERDTRKAPPIWCMCVCYVPITPRLLCTWDFAGKNTGVGCHALLQGIFVTQGSKLQPLSLRSPALIGGFFTTSTIWVAQLYGTSK